MANNTFNITNLSAGTVSVCGENIAAGATEDVLLDKLYDQPEYTEDISDMLNNGLISVAVPLITDNAVSMKEKSVIDWLNNASPLYGVKADTTASTTLYVDGTLGDDDNNGLTAATPKQSILAAWNSLPRSISRNTENNNPLVLDPAIVIRVKGTVSIPNIANGYVLAGKEIQKGAGVYIVGVDDYVVFDDNGGSHYTATSSSTSSVTVSGAGWTVNEWLGRYIKMVDGPEAGRLFGVLKNSTDTLTILGGTDVGSNNFDFANPGTVINGVGSNSAIGVWGISGHLGYIHFQDLHLTGYASFKIFDSSMSFGTNGVTVDRAGGDAVLDYGGLGSVGLSSYNERYNKDTGAFAAAANYEYLGIATTNSSITMAGSGFIYGSAIAGNVTSNSKFLGIALNSYVAGSVTARNNGPSVVSPVNVTLLSSSTVDGGVVIEGGLVRLAACTINNGAGHGLEIKGADVIFTGVVAGSATGGHGVYIHRRSSLEYLIASPPTISGDAGASGDLTVDGSADASTWAAITGGTPVAILAELSMVKAV